MFKYDNMPDKEGDVKLVSELTLDEILENYIKLDNIDDLLDSDILILPIDKKEGYLLSQPFDMIRNCGEVDIRYYAYDQNKIEYHVFASTWQYIQMGAVIVSTIAGLVEICNFVMKKHGNDGNTRINIQLFNKTVNNTYIGHDYKGDIHTFCNIETEKMKDDFKTN